MKNTRFNMLMILILAGLTGLMTVDARTLNRITGSDINYYTRTSLDTTGQADDVEIVGVPTGDEPSRELEKLVNASHPVSGIEYKGTMNVIDDNGDEGKIIERNDFAYTMLDADNYQYKVGKLEYIKKDRLMLSIDHENKTIAVIRT